MRDEQREVDWWARRRGSALRTRYKRDMSEQIKQMLVMRLRVRLVLSNPLSMISGLLHDCVSWLMPASTQASHACILTQVPKCKEK